MKSGNYLPFAIIALLIPALFGQDSIQTTTDHPVIDPVSTDVQSSITYDLGDRLLTIQKVTEATLPAPPRVPVPAKVTSPPLAEAMEPSADDSNHHDLSMGGTVFRPVTGPARSLISYYQGNGAAPIVFWSSIDWNLMTQGGFESPDGQHYSMMLMLSTVDVATLAEIHSIDGENAKLPELPDFPAGPASFRIVSGQATPQVQADLKALHAIHDRDHAALLAAWNAREAARIKAEAERAANPPKPENIVLRYRMLKPEEIQPK